MNGDIGIINEILDSSVYMLANNEEICINDKNDIELAYASTIHKSQGSAFNIVILCTPRQHTFTLTSNLLYVGLTRMRTRCYHLGEINAVNIAVKKKEDKNRRTFMLDFLVHDIQ